MTNNERPLSIAILAVGGQGGGVLARWLVDTAEANGYLAHSTFVAGVAQRTGATVYCVEMFPAERARELGRSPVFTPYPIPGDVDIVIAGEMAETGRALQKGFVTPNATTLIASNHRIYSIVEKEALGDGIVDQSRVAEIAGKASRRFICFDMQAVAETTGSIINAVLLGAIAGSGALPFGRAAFEAIIRQSHRAVEANLAGFEAGFEAATSGTQALPQPANDEDRLPPATPRGPAGERLAKRIASELPPDVRDIALHGALRALDYQDEDYAGEYLERIVRVESADRTAGGTDRAHVLTTEVARQLALQMCYEDTIRVADLKIRANRFDRIRRQVATDSGEPLNVVEYFHPRLEEVCDTLPAALGARITESQRLQRLLRPLFNKGRNITTTNISGFLLLRILASWRRFRRGSYRFAKQTAFIDDWLQRVVDALAKDYDYAVSIARCIEIVRGYGDTHQRGLDRYLAIISTADSQPSARRADVVSRLQHAALADEDGRVFAEARAALERS